MRRSHPLRGITCSPNATFSVCHTGCRSKFSEIKEPNKVRECCVSKKPKLGVNEEPSEEPDTRMTDRRPTGRGPVGVDERGEEFFGAGRPMNDGPRAETVTGCDTA
ncbi:unnamed protein product, partial [Trichogramma brassicae]